MRDDNGNLLEIRNLKISFGDFEALHGIDLSLRKGMLVGLIGPNGCGKSTMMKCISKVNKGWTGSIVLDGNDVSSTSVSQLARLVANVPAEAGQTFGMTVSEMVMLGRYPFADRVWWESRDDERKVSEALDIFGLSHYRRKELALLSSGEKQRALIAKAYVQEPKLMLVDEPTSHLDMKYKLQVMKYLKKLADSDMTVLVAEHDISLMARYCDICVIMKKGNIVAMGEPKEIITEDLIREVYEVDARIGLDADGEIYVLPKEYVGGE